METKVKDTYTNQKVYEQNKKAMNSSIPFKDVFKPGLEQ